MRAPQARAMGKLVSAIFAKSRLEYIFDNALPCNISCPLTCGTRPA